MSLWDLGVHVTSHWDLMGYGSEALGGTGFEALSFWGLGGTGWNLQGLGSACRKPSGVRVLSLWDLGDACFEPLGSDGVQV